MKRDGLYRLEGYTLDGWIDLIRTMLYEGEHEGLEVHNVPELQEMLTEIEALEPIEYSVRSIKWEPGITE